MHLGEIHEAALFDVELKFPLRGRDEPLVVRGLCYSVSYGWISEKQSI